MSPLHVASERGHVSCVEALIGLKADVLQCDQDGESSAQIANKRAYRNRFSDIVAALVRAGAAPP